MRLVDWPEAIKAAVSRRVEEQLPGEQQYMDLCPRDFVRPSTLIELTGGELQTGGEMGAGAAHVVWHLRLTGFVVTDAVHDSHLPQLDRKAASLMLALRGPRLKAGDRGLTVTPARSRTELYDCVIVECELHLCEALAVLMGDSGGDDAPLMEQVYLAGCPAQKEKER